MPRRAHGSGTKITKITKLTKTIGLLVALVNFVIFVAAAVGPPQSLLAANTCASSNGVVTSS
jgi:hypothetical protein